jgi:hypothetical protein
MLLPGSPKAPLMQALNEAIARQAPRRVCFQAEDRHSERVFQSDFDDADRRERFERDDPFAAFVWVTLTSRGVTKRREVPFANDGVDRRVEVEGQVAEAIDELGAEFDREEEPGRRSLLTRAIGRQHDKGRATRYSMRTNRPDMHSPLVEKFVWVTLASRGVRKNRDVPFPSEGVDWRPEMESLVAQAIDELGAEFDLKENEIAETLERMGAAFYALELGLSSTGREPSLARRAATGAEGAPSGSIAPSAKPQTWRDRPPML